MPRSPCGPGCVSADMPTVGLVLGDASDESGCVVVLVLGWLLCPLLVVLRGPGRDVLVRGVFRTLLRAFGARLEVLRGAAGVRRGARGSGGGQPCVLAGHRGGERGAADAVGGQAGDRVVAVGGDCWPARAGTVYLDRERLRALPGTVAELAGALRAGHWSTSARRAPRGAGRVWGGFGPLCSRPPSTVVCRSGRSLCGIGWPPAGHHVAGVRRGRDADRLGAADGTVARAGGRGARVAGDRAWPGRRSVRVGSVGRGRRSGCAVRRVGGGGRASRCRRDRVARVRCPRSCASRAVAGPPVRCRSHDGVVTATDRRICWCRYRAGLCGA